MEVYYDLDNLPAFHNAVVTIGSFDGVHYGHRKIIQRVKQLAERCDGESVVITFHPHPRQVIYPQDTSIALLTSIEEKVQLLEQYGVDHLVVVPFTIEFSQQQADEYIQRFLIEKFHPQYIVIGYDHRFGLNRQGDINYLRWYSEQSDYQVVEIAKEEIDHIAVSSTKIRQAIGRGEIETANRLLGHRFPLTGTVVHGQKLGKKLGFPTANLKIADPRKLIPPQGIYAAYIYYAGERYDGMLYIGNRPTLKGRLEQTIEVNLFNFNGDLYGETLRIELVAFIRQDIKFATLDELKTQLAIDRNSSGEVFKKLTEQARHTAPVIPAVAIVILNYNGKKYLERFLPAVQRSAYEALEIYVADNGSTDGSLSWLEKHHPDIRRIDLRRNHGYAEGYNRALQQVVSDYYILLNSDVEVSPGWIDPIIQCLESDKTIAACQPKILDYRAPSYFEYAGASGGWIDALGYPFCRGRIFNYTEADDGQYDDNAEIFWATGAALFIRAELFHQIGGFDPDYFAHAEEIDLCWRLKRAGYKIKVVPASAVRHVGGGTLSYSSPNKTYLNFRNTLYTLFKNEERRRVWWVLIARLLLDGLAGMLFLSQSKFSHIWAIIRAHWAFFPRLPYLWKRRKHYQKLVSETAAGATSNTRGRYRGSIVWQYYGLGRRHFAEVMRPKQRKSWPQL